MVDAGVVVGSPPGLPMRGVVVVLTVDVVVVVVELRPLQRGATRLRGTAPT